MTRLPVFDVKRNLPKNILAGDGVTGYYGTCNFCGKTDILNPVHSLNMCPNCLKKGCWNRDQVMIVRSGFCDICGVHFIGAGVHIASAYACFKCLWIKLGKKQGALRPQGRHIV